MRCCVNCILGGPLEYALEQPARRLLIRLIFTEAGMPLRSLSSDFVKIDNSHDDLIGIFWARSGNPICVAMCNMSELMEKNIQERVFKRFFEDGPPEIMLVRAPSRGAGSNGDLIKRGRIEIVAKT